jgi:hypothetical protein
LARRNQRESGLSNVEFLLGYIEDVPFPPNPSTWSSRIA